MYRCLTVLFVLAAVATYVPIASANPYVITDIGVLPGDTTSGAYGINDSGQVAGVSSNYVSGTDFADHAILYSGGSLTDLGAIVGNTTFYAGAYAINDSGAVVFSVHGARKLSYIYSGGTITNFYQQGGCLNQEWNQALAINNSGQAAGWYEPPVPGSSDTDAFLYSGGTNGTSSDIETGSANNPFYNTTGYGINNLGAVVGNGFLYAGNPPMPYYYPFVWTASGGMQQVTVAAGTADAINDSGVVVGSTGLDRSPGSAFVATPVGGTYVSTTLPSLGDGTTDGAYAISNTGVVVGESAGKATVDTESSGAWTTTDLNTLISPTSGWTLQVAEGISNNGNYICGVGTIDGQTHGFLLETAIAGDANLDGKVDINDLTIVLSHYGQTGMAWSQGEFTGDGTVDINDLTIVLAHYNDSLGSSAAGIAPVPEPASLLLALAGGAGPAGLRVAQAEIEIDATVEPVVGC